MLPLPQNSPPPPDPAELPVTVQLVSEAEPKRTRRPPPLPLAELPLTVQLVSVTVPPLMYRPPPSPSTLPPVIVSFDSAADVPGLRANTRLVSLPLIASR